MKYLGIDYGTKRIGLASSDLEGRMAFPLRVIARTRNAVLDIARICLEEGIEEIVLGESRNFANEYNPIMKEIIPFREALMQATGLHVIFVPEVLSSREAMHIQGDNSENDASAAAIVLQSHLDRINPPRVSWDEEDEMTSTNL